MISLLTPSRLRPAIFKRMFDSAIATARHPEDIEIVARFDDDDVASADEARSLPGVVVITGPRIPEMTVYWNECFSACHGDIVCQNNDDVIFRTPGWDLLVAGEFSRYPDHLVMVHGNDLGMHLGTFGPHPFVHRRWVELLGYFIPPYFVSDHGDAWVNELATNVHRRVFLPFVMEHMHSMFGKAEIDSTTADRLLRHQRLNPSEVWNAKFDERVAQIALLRSAIADWKPEAIHGAD